MVEAAKKETLKYDVADGRGRRQHAHWTERDDKLQPPRQVDVVACTVQHFHT
jgi:hypothetical protein